MNRNLLLGLVIVANLCVIGTLYFLDKQATTQAFTNLKELIVSKLQPAINTWNNLPGTYKTMIMAGIPTALTIFGAFMAWAKMQWQKKAIATQAQINQVSGEKIEAEKQLSQSIGATVDMKKELDSTKSTLKLYEDFYEANKQMAEKVNAIPQQITNMESRFQGDVSYLSNQIKSLQTKIEEAKKVK